MQMEEYQKKDRFSWNGLALVLIITANICFYTEEMLLYYMIMTIAGIIIAVAKNVVHFSFKVQSSNCILWLIATYLVFFVYGFFFLAAGKFAWDSFLIRFAENVAIYLAIKGLFFEREERVVKPFIIAGIISALYLVIKESATIISGGIRIGDTLSGNVNTVGFNFGFISLLVIWNYCKTKKKINLLLFAVFALLMLLTGSKKALLILILDLIMILIYQKGKASTWLKLGLLIAIVAYAIFNVPYLYDILGLRIETMIATIIGRKSAALGLYSYSTDMREVMIKEAFDLFLGKPIFGGGFNYFLANTVTQYEYSHCNYTELLCSFGLFGTLIYYSKQISNLRYIIKGRLYRNREYMNIGIVCLMLMVEMLVVDWATVTFSGQCMGYIPIIFSCAALDYVRRKRANEK